MLNEDIITKLEEQGFKRWTKGNMDRLYINASDLGLECSFYKTGNISDAYFRDERISNSEGYRMKNAKTYIDIHTGKVHSDNRTLEQAAAELLESLTGKEVEA